MSARRVYVHGLPEKTKQPFRKAFEYAPLGVALVSYPKGRAKIVEANRALAVITGRADASCADSTSRTWSSLRTGIPIASSDGCCWPASSTHTAFSVG